MQRAFLIEMALCKGISLWKGCLLNDFLLEKFVVKGLLYRQTLLCKVISLWKKALSKRISFWNRLVVKAFSLE